MAFPTEDKVSGGAFFSTNYIPIILSIFSPTYLAFCARQISLLWNIGRVWRIEVISIAIAISSVGIVGLWVLG
jgi:hypothetical protein